MRKLLDNKLLKDPDIVDKIQLTFLIISYVVSSLALLVVPLSSKLLVDSITNQNAIDVRILVIIIIAICISSLLMFYFGDYKIKKANLKFYENLVNKIYKQSIKMFPSDYEEFDSGFIHNLYYAESQTIAANLVNIFVIMPASFIQFFIFAIILVFINLKLSLIILLSLPIYLFIVSRSAKKRTLLNQDAIKTNDVFVRTTNNFKDNIASIKETKEDIYFQNKYFKTTNDNTKTHERFYFHFFLGNRLTQLITNILPIIMLFLSYSNIVNGKMTLGEVLMFIQIASYMFEPLTNFFHIVTEAKSIKPYLERIESFLYKDSNEYELYYSLFDDSDSITLDNVMVLSKEDEALYNTNIKFKEKGFFIIKGPNGSGKSTLLRLIAGLNSSSGFKKGSVHIPAKYKNNIGFLFYPLFNFEGSVKDNIIFDSNKDIVLKELLDDSFYNKEIKINPINLSSGQAQKISLLRVLNRDTRVIFLDEPTSNLEKESIKHLETYIEKEKYNKLIVAIMHTNDFDYLADEILHIKDGKIIKGHDFN